MYPAAIALPDELREAYLPLLLHLLYEVEQTAISPLPSSPKGEVFRYRGAFLPPLTLAPLGVDLRLGGRRGMSVGCDGCRFIGIKEFRLRT